MISVVEEVEEGICGCIRGSWRIELVFRPIDFIMRLVVRKGGIVRSIDTVEGAKKGQNVCVC